MKRIFALSLLGINLYAYNVELMYSTLKFDYKEYQNSSVIDQEDSSFSDLTGINFSLSQDINRFKLKLDFEYNKGHTQYTGSTWGGKPLKLTENNSYLYNTRLIGNYALFNDETTLGIGKFYLSGGLGYRYWNRGKSDYVGDYDEKYKWKYWLIGASINDKFNKFDFDLNFYYHKAISPTLRAELGKGYTFDLGKTSGYRLEIPIRYHLSQNYGVMVKYIYDYWKINKSNTIDGIYEPDSKTKNKYLNLGFYYNF